MTFIPVLLRKPLARDGAWLVGSAVVARIFGTVAQIVMGIIIARDDYLVWGIATSFIAILGSAKDGGAGKLLLQGLNRNASDTKRSMIYGYRVVAASTNVAVIAAPIIGRLYDSNTVTGLILVGAISIGLNGLSLLPKANITVAGKYPDLSRIQMASSLAATATMICCGLAGLGAFSFAIALGVGGGVRLIGMSQTARRLKADDTAQPPQVLDTSRTERRWLLASTVATALIMNVDYMVLGAVAPEILAAYFFGFQLTLTLSVLVAPAMEQTLLPHFSRLGVTSGRDNPVRKMLMAITLVVTPLSLCACLLTPSIVRLLWGDKWVDAIPVIQIFSVGVGVRLLLPVLITHLQSQRRWKRVAIFYYVDAFLVFLATLVSARFGLVAVAAAVTIARSTSIFSLLVFVLRQNCGPIDILRIFTPFIAVTLVVVWALSHNELLPVPR